MEIMHAYARRRSIYALNGQVDFKQVQSIVEQCVTVTPSPFNVQSARVVLLTPAAHQALWSQLKEVLRNLVRDEAKFAAGTGPKLDGFRAAAGTVLYYIDDSKVAELQAKVPSYAVHFPTWAEHENAMLQYAVWSALAAQGIGANLQHYSPLADPIAAALAKVPASWRLIAQMPFGAPAQAWPAMPPRLPVAERLHVI